MTADPDSAYAHLLSPFQIGPMKLRNRVVLPPHASAIGNIFGSEADAERNLAYYVSRARGGAAWFDSLSAWVPNTGVIPGFEPTGVGATVEGHYGLPFFVERVQAYSDALHAEGEVLVARRLVATKTILFIVGRNGLPSFRALVEGPAPAVAPQRASVLVALVLHHDEAADEGIGIT